MTERIAVPSYHLQGAYQAAADSVDPIESSMGVSVGAGGLGAITPDGNSGVNGCDSAVDEGVSESGEDGSTTVLEEPSPIYPNHELLSETTLP